MNPEQWQQIQRLYYLALELEAEQRTAFLERECAGDGDIYQEVLSLLAAHEQAEGFIAEPAIDGLAQELTVDQTQNFVGHDFGHYHIFSLLGRGGMGAVYLARDMRLGRKVALKLLPPEFAEDRNYIRRFEREAYAASALNHPNILTVYETGQLEGSYFIATEFVEGQTLRQRMKQGMMTLRQVLDIAVQITDALIAAHKAGIIHRDIKPENVMLRPDGYVKILDFGIARITTYPTGLPTEKATTAFRTKPGQIIGTPAYMSPEQVRGLSVDQRSDIFSFGIMLYEMIAGCPPFAGTTTADILVAILEKEPPSLQRLRADVSPTLEKVVTKALSKEREARFQTASDLRTALTAQNETRGAVRGSRKAIWRQLSLASLIVLILSAIAFGGYWIKRFINPSPPSFRGGIVKLTNVGKVTASALSPDGKYFAYAAEEGGKQGLWVRQVSGANPVPIVPLENAEYTGLTFAPSSDSIYYVVYEAGEDNGKLYCVPMLGGTPRKLTTNIDTAVTFSPDGKRYAFGRGDSVNEEAALIVSNADGTEERKLARHSFGDAFCLSGIAWSPDGKIIACTRSVKDKDDQKYDNVVIVRVDDGSESPPISPTSRPWRAINGLAWERQGGGLFTIAAEQGALPAQLYYLPYPKGNPQRISQELNSYSGVSVSSDAGQLVSLRTEHVSNIWIAQLNGETSQAKQITFGVGIFSDVAWTPDGKIVASGLVNDSFNIWQLNAEGKNQRQLTFGSPMSFRPTVSPDNRYIVYVSDQKGSYHLWRIDSNGGQPVQLTKGDSAFTPQFTPDGSQVYYYSHKPNIWKVLISGDNPVAVTNQITKHPTISPQGDRIACHHLGEDAKWRIAIMPIGGGSVLKTFDFPLHEYQLVRWAPDGQSLSYVAVQNGVGNLWTQPVGGGSPRPFTNFTSDQIFFYDWSRDGKQLALLRGHKSKDVVLLKE